MRTWALMGVAAAALTLQVGAATAQEIKIGFGGIFSGPYSTYSEDARKAMDIFVAEFNAKGGWKGRKLVVDYYDTGADRAKAIAIYRKWASQPEYVVDLTISSIEYLAMDPIANEVKLPILPFGSTAPYKAVSDWSFRTAIIADQAEPYVMAQVKKLKNANSMYVLYDTANPSMVGAAKAAEKNAPPVGIQVKGVDTFATNDQDFSAQLTKVEAAKPDVLYVGGSTYEASLLITQARAMGIKSIIVGGAGLNDPRISNLPNKASEGLITYFAFDPADPRPLVKNFVDAYKARYKSDPPNYAALGYDVLLYVTEAIKSADSTDRDAVRKALGTTKGLEVLNGTLTFNGAGDNLDQKPHIYENRGGKFARLD